MHTMLAFTQHNHFNLAGDQKCGNIAVKARTHCGSAATGQSWRRSQPSRWPRWRHGPLRERRLLVTVTRRLSLSMAVRQAPAAPSPRRSTANALTATRAIRGRVLSQVSIAVPARKHSAGPFRVTTPSGCGTNVSRSAESPAAAALSWPHATVRMPSSGRPTESSGYQAPSSSIHGRANASTTRMDPLPTTPRSAFTRATGHRLRSGTSHQARHDETPGRLAARS